MMPFDTSSDPPPGGLAMSLKERGAQKSKSQPACQKYLLFSLMQVIIIMIWDGSNNDM